MSETHQHTGGWDAEWSALHTTFEEPAQPWIALCERVKAQFVLQVAGGIRGKSVLEVGCGGAVASCHLAKSGARITAMDRSEAALALARRNFAKAGVRARAVVGDAEAIPGRGGYDLVMSFGLLEHFDDPSPAMREMARVLRPGGLLFAEVVPRKLSIQSLANIWNAGLKIVVFGATFRFRRLATSLRHQLPDYHESRFGPERYAEILLRLGLTAEAAPAEPFPRLSLPVFLARKYAAWGDRRASVWAAFRLRRDAGAFRRAAAFYVWGHKT